MTLTAQRRAAFLEEIGIGPQWLPRTAIAALNLPDADKHDFDGRFEPVDIKSPDAAPAVVDARLPVPGERDAIPVEDMDWRQLQNAVAECTRCGLCRGRTNTVFGVGDQQAKWMFVGEGPGRNEDLRGEPFIGPAGQLLDNMLLAIGLRRGDNAYITNIVKCRAVDVDGRDRRPTADEIAACMPYLQRQIALIKPAIIVALGKTAALSLLQLDPQTSVSHLRGTVHRYADLPLVVTCHPAYLLRNLPDKKEAWADLCLAMETYASRVEH